MAILEFFALRIDTLLSIHTHMYLNVEAELQNQNSSDTLGNMPPNPETKNLIQLPGGHFGGGINKI